MHRRALAVGAWRQEHGHEQWIEVEGTGRGGHAHCNSKMSDDDEEEIVLLKGPAVTLDDGGRGAVVADGVAATPEPVLLDVGPRENAAGTTAAGAAPATEEKAAGIIEEPGPVEEHRLHSSWSIWEHARSNASDTDASYRDGKRLVCSMSTVEQMWAALKYVPSPSDFFSDGNQRHDFINRSIEALSIFRDGIEPMWEDPANASGGEWNLRTSMHLNILDVMWEETILALLGETMIDAHGELCGCRVVDKSKKTGRSYRLELWFRTGDNHAIRTEIQRKWSERLRTGLMARQIQPPQPWFKFSCRSHAD